MSLSKIDRDKIDRDLLAPIRRKHNIKLIIDDFESDYEDLSQTKFFMEISSWGQDITKCEAPIKINLTINSNRIRLAIDIDALYARKSSLEEAYFATNKRNYFSSRWIWYVYFSDMDSEFTGRFSGGKTTNPKILYIRGKYVAEFGSVLSLSDICHTLDGAIRDLDGDVSSLEFDLEDELIDNPESR